jgi:lipopolysaccharide export system protein LptC
MSELAERERIVKRGWARPGSGHDVLVGTLKILLPALIGVLLAYLALAPLTRGGERSFLLDKQKVDVAGERMRVQRAQYRGIDQIGRPFTLNAEQAVQLSSADPVVDIRTMWAQIALDEGPARIEAERARYDMERQAVDVVGPVLFTAADGYRLETRDVAVDLGARRMASRGRVEGRMPLGRFSADRMEADLPSRRVVLTGRARVHIVQGALR